MKKLLPLLLLSASCLASCGESTIYGNYVFSLGRQGANQTRVSVAVDLKDEISTYKQDYKNLQVLFELPGMSDELTLDLDEEEAELAKGTSQFLFDFLKEDGVGEIDENGIITLNGFYKVSDVKDEKLGNKIRLAFNFQMINDLLNEIGIDPTNIIQNFVVSYCNNTTFTIQVPVSLNDIQQQLVWYGIYFDYNPYIKDKVRSIQDIVDYFAEGKLSIDDFKYYNLLDYEDHQLIGEQNLEVRFGSHPLVEYEDDEVTIKTSQVDEVNEKYVGLFSNTYVYENIEGEAGDKIGTLYFDNAEECYYFYPLDGYTFDVYSSINCIIKEDVGVLDYDFSLEREVELWVTPWTDRETGKVYYMFAPQSHVVGEEPNEWDWKRFYQKPFEFRDFHDIKVGLTKE